MDRFAADHLDTFGFVVLRALFEPSALAQEFDAVMRDAFADTNHLVSGTAGNEFRFVPTMCERTPVSLQLVGQLSRVAAGLLGAPVLPGRAKATTYFGCTQWHRDSELAIRSIGVICYLDPLDADSGALRVLPGSHRGDLAIATLSPAPDVELSGVSLPTRPGDAIVFDEHLLHASNGGTPRRQWRVDFIVDTGDDDALRSYFASQMMPASEAGYDIDRYPSGGAHWQAVDRGWRRRLEALVVDG